MAGNDAPKVWIWVGEQDDVSGISHNLHVADNSRGQFLSLQLSGSIPPANRGYQE